MPIHLVLDCASARLQRATHYFQLHLHNPTRLVGTSFRYYQVPTHYIVLAVHDRADRAGGVNDRRTRRIGHESRQRLQWPFTATLVCKRENIWLLGFKSGHGSLQHLDQSLIEQRNASRRFVFAAWCLAAFHCTKRKMNGLTGDAKPLQISRTVALRHGARHIVIACGA
jgi:hypothetical protein